MGLQGIHSGSVAAVEQIVLETLTRVAATGEGLEPERIEAVLHQVEVALRHVSSHFGIGMPRYAARRCDALVASRYTLRCVTLLYVLLARNNAAALSCPPCLSVSLHEFLLHVCVCGCVCANVDTSAFVCGM